MTNMIFVSFVYFVGIIVVIGLGWTLKGHFEKKDTNILSEKHI
jgi:hypothetical protein